MSNLFQNFYVGEGRGAHPADWYFRCPHCEKFQLAIKRLPLSPRGTLACEFCEKEVSPFDVMKGQWRDGDKVVFTSGALDRAVQQEPAETQWDMLAHSIPKS